MINDTADIDLREVHAGDNIVRVKIHSFDNDIEINIGKVHSMRNYEDDKTFPIDVMWENKYSQERVYLSELTCKESDFVLYCIQKEEINDEIIVKMIESLYSNTASIYKEKLEKYSKLGSSAQEIYDNYKGLGPAKVKQLIKKFNEEELKMLLSMLYISYHKEISKVTFTKIKIDRIDSIDKEETLNIVQRTLDELRGSKNIGIVRS